VDDDRLAPDVCQVILMLFFDAARLFWGETGAELHLFWGETAAEFRRNDNGVPAKRQRSSGEVVRCASRNIGAPMR
jgi:hypothetical protein